MRTPLCLALALLALPAAAGCGTTQAPLPFDRDPFYASPPGEPRSGAAALAALDARGEDGRKWLAGCHVVFRGRVLAVGRSPGFSSGVVVVTQPVLYEVLETLRGGPLEARVVVRHLLAGGAMEDPSTLRLHPAIFREGAELVVAASWSRPPGSDEPPRLEDHYEPVGPLPATEAVLARVR